MIRPQSVVLVEPADDEGGLRVRSPAVGIYRDAPRVGEVLLGGSLAGRIVRLGQTIDLLMPRGSGGR